MTPQGVSTLGELVVIAVAGAADVYLAGGARLAGQYEKESQKFYEDHWTECKNLDERARKEFTRSLVTSDLWKMAAAGPGASGGPPDGDAVITETERAVAAKTGPIKAELETLLAQVKARTGHQEMLEKLQGLFQRCADRTRQAWGGFAFLIVLIAGTYGFYISGSPYYGSYSFLLLLAGAIAGGVVYVSSTDWNRASTDLKRCRTELLGEIKKKIHFAEPPVAGLLTPPVAPIATLRPATPAEGPDAPHP
jgi:hypothetical protein